MAKLCSQQVRSDIFWDYATNERTLGNISYDHELIEAKALTKLDFHIIILTEIYTTSIDFIRSLFLRVFSRYFKKINTNKYRLPALVVKDIYRT